jgi:Flp pilus assembly protein TadG
MSLQPRTPVRRRRRSRSRGQALVEFALVFPVFFLILAGLLDFGFLLYSRITLINATREGARAAVTQVDNAQGIPGLVKSTIQTNATGLTLADLSDSETCVAKTQSNCDFASGGNPDPQSGDAVRVTTTYIYRSFFARLFGSTISFSTSIDMVIE